MNDSFCAIARVLILIGMVVAIAAAAAHYDTIAAVGGAVGVGAGAFVHTYCEGHNGGTTGTPSP